MLNASTIIIIQQEENLVEQHALDSKELRE
jgi:hypothetical protein